MTSLAPHPDNLDEDAVLVRALQDGDLQAFQPLVEGHLDSLHAFVSLKLPIPHLVNEITHETLVCAFHHIGEFQAGTNFRAWLRAIAVNRIRIELKRISREARNQLAYAECRAWEESLEGPDASDQRSLDALKECLERLPEHLRGLLQLRYHEERSSEQIAGLTERSLAWVRTTLCRARQQLKHCIERKLNTQPS